MIEGMRIIRESGHGLNICLETFLHDFDNSMKLVLAESGVAKDSKAMRCLLDKTRFLDPNSSFAWLDSHSTKVHPGYKKRKQRLIEHLKADRTIWTHLMSLRKWVNCYRPDEK